jgi:protein-tyrosine phosphatase
MRLSVHYYFALNLMAVLVQFCSVLSLQQPPTVPSSRSTASRMAFGRATTSLKSTAASNFADLPSSQFSLDFFKTKGSTETLHNFGPASPLDSILFSAERPGNPLAKDGRVKTEQVDDWINFIRSKGITNVIALLDESELGIYEAPGLLKMYEQAGMKCYLKPMGKEGASENILATIDQVEQRGEKVVTHCTGGSGRCGRVAAAWVSHRYKLAPEVATLIVLDQAAKSGVERVGHTEKLIEWLN